MSGKKKKKIIIINKKEKKIKNLKLLYRYLKEIFYR
jgi:hypothetical protein